MTEREKQEAVNALGWIVSTILVGALFLAPLWLPASWILR